MNKRRGRSSGNYYRKYVKTEKWINFQSKLMEVRISVRNNEFKNTSSISRNTLSNKIFQMFSSVKIWFQNVDFRNNSGVSYIKH